MTGKDPRSIGDLLQSGDISRLTTEAAARRKLAAEVRLQLPDAESAHVVSAHIDGNGDLVVGMDSPAWAARLRYSTQELLGRNLRVKTSVPRGGSV
jgi:hypothetical protein